MYPITLRYECELFTLCGTAIDHQRVKQLTLWMFQFIYKTALPLVGQRSLVASQKSLSLQHSRPKLRRHKIQQSTSRNPGNQEHSGKAVPNTYHFPSDWLSGKIFISKKLAFQVQTSVSLGTLTKDGTLSACSHVRHPLESFQRIFDRLREDDITSSPPI